MIKNTTRLKHRLGVACATLGIFAATINSQPAWSQSAAQTAAYPSRTVRMIVAFTAGGIADTVARIVGQRLTARLGQPVVVENRAGAGGILGAKVVAAAAPDGYTILVTTTSIAVNASNSKEGVDPVVQLTPVSIAASTPTIFIAPASTKENNLLDYVRNAKQSRVTFASAGVGTAEHLAAEYVFKSLPGIAATHVPYQGGAPVNTAVVSQQVDLASTTYPTAAPYLRQGSMRALAVASRTRMTLLPDVPTLAEAGFPELHVASWIGFFVPPGTPPDLVQKLNAEINQVLNEADSKERLRTIGMDPQLLSQPEFTKYVKEEVVKWERLIKATGITPN